MLFRSIFTVFGENMGPANLIQAGFPLPTELSGTSIRISASGNDVSAFIIYTSATQLAAVLPSTTPLGPAIARVTYNGQQGAALAFTVVAGSPGLFTLNSRGSGPAVLTAGPDFKVITYGNAALEGETLSAWATGVTALQGRADDTAAEAFDPPLTVEVIVGGIQANVRYRGRAPTLAGVDQIVFDVPMGVRGCNVSLLMKVGGAISNFTTLAVGGANRLCSDPGGLSEADVAKARQDGLRIGAVTLKRNRTKVAVSGLGTVEQRADSASADFTYYDAASFVRSQRSVSPGNCIVSTHAGEAAPPDSYSLVKLNAGAQLSLTGPGGTRAINRDAATGLYAASLGSAQVIPGFPTPGSGLFLDPGTYIVTGPDGPDVGAFIARVTVPEPLATSLDSIATVSRGASLTVTWTGGAANEYVAIRGFSSRSSPKVTATLTCIERATAGRFTIPAEVFLAMPPSEVVQGAPMGELSVGSFPAIDVARFMAGGLDVGYLSYSSIESKAVPFQ